MKAINALLALTTLFSPTTATALPSTNPSSNPRLQWLLKPTNNTQQFRGLSPISPHTVWLAGTNSTVLLTKNGGHTWSDVSPQIGPENSTTLQFRDVQAFSSKSAVVLSIGEGNLSRIYQTLNGGKSWKATFINTEPTAFYDCMAFADAKHGLALSDPVAGKFRLIETWDGGATWRIVDPAGMPDALAGESGFAASGSCIEAAAGRWYIASGGVDPGRVFRSEDGHVWEVGNSSIVGGAAAGVFSVRFRDYKNGIAVGGDYEKPAGNVDNAAWSKDGGRTWQKAESFPGGYRSGVSLVPGGRTAVAVGTSGSDITYDGGRNYHAIGNGTFDAVECVDKHTCWASGSGGRVAVLKMH